jgi:hypothetical protein
MAKDVIQSHQASGSAYGLRVDPARGGFPGSLHWMKQRANIVKLADMQEDASNKLSSAMSVFIEIISVMKMVIAVWC